MKYFILLASSIIILGLSACGDETCDNTVTPPEQDTVGQVGDAVSEVSSDAVTLEERPDAVADVTVSDAAEAEDAQLEVVADTVEAGDPDSSSE